MSRRTSGVILASGLSRRFTAGNKLLMPVDGIPLVRRTASVYVDAGLSPVMTVVGYDGYGVRKALDGLAVLVIENPDYAEGQSRALRHGVAALPADVEAAVIGVADQPFLTSQVLRALVERWEATDAPLVAPLYAGTRGNPILFARSLFAELLHVEGDQGGRPVFNRHGREAEYVAISDERAAVDIDTDEDYARLV